jgi:hypothetical protein
MSVDSHCPCDTFVHPAVITNPPGLTTIHYRAGDFAAFRHALLLPRPGETALAAWRPGAEGDLAVQLVEWWAVLADILTFYNERILHQAFLRPAELPEAVNNLVRLLGYRPRPGIAAHGVVAALIDSATPVTIRRGFAIQSKPGPGQQPQIFESDADVTFGGARTIEVDPPDAPELLTRMEGVSSILLAGTVTSIKAGDRLLLRKRQWTARESERSFATVREVRKETTPRGRKNTRVLFTTVLPISPLARAADWLLLRARESAQLFTTAAQPIVAVMAFPSAFDQFTAGGQIQMTQAQFLRVSSTVQQVRTLQAVRTRPVLQENELHLEGIASGIEADDAVVLTRPGDERLARVLRTTRALWYANPADANVPQASPDPKTAIPIPVLHSVLTLSPVIVETEIGDWNAASGAVKVTFGWTELGTLIGTPALSVATAGTASLLALPPIPATATPAGVLLEDSNGAGTGASLARVTASGNAVLEQLAALTLTPPLRLLTNLVPVSRGKSVASEPIGSGDAAVAGQQFVLKKSPLTYVQSGQSYASTLRVHVNDVAWHEVTSFYGQPAGAKVFVTREDAQQETHVVFGDGVNGARLPSGRDNVVASYRYGSGQEVPAPGALNVVLNPQPGVRGIRNPVVMAGGSEPDPPAKVRRYAPRSVLMFDRAVSGKDYEVVAAQAPGVRRARAYWSFDAVRQRAGVTLYVGDTDGAVASARTALLGARDPNRMVTVQLAEPVDFALTVALRIHPDFLREPVLAGVRHALADDDAGLFGSTVRIGQTFFDSEIHQACLSVPGVVAVSALRAVASARRLLNLRRLPEGRFFRLVRLDLEAEG